MREHSNELENVKSRSLNEIIIRYCNFYPAVRHAFLLGLTLSPTTLVLKSALHSALLRRVKTWLLITSGEDRAGGLCLISVHRNKINESIQEITKS